MRKRGWEKIGADKTNAGKLDEQDELTQTENPSINTERISGEDGRHLEGVETSTRTGETDQSVTHNTVFKQLNPLNAWLSIYRTNKHTWQFLRHVYARKKQLDLSSTSKHCIAMHQ
jgi:hypothetical protein